MLLGSRVVRGPDWSYGDQDGGEGSVGTIISDTEFDDGTKLFRGTVPVCWDNGFTAGYRVGLEGCYDLRLLDSEPSEVTINNVTCADCGLTICGMCWNCMDCPDHDLCTDCYMNDGHCVDHRFICKLHEYHQGIFVGAPRSASEKIQAKGIFPGAEVVPRFDDLITLGTGTVIELPKSSGSGIRGVYWDELDTTLHHSVGHKGEVELKLIKSADGPFYYRDHLPVVAMDELKLSQAMAKTKELYHEEETDLFENDREEDMEFEEKDEVLEVGDSVTIHRTKDVQRLRYEMEEREAAKFVGEVGKITKIEQEGVFVKYEALGSWKFQDWRILSKVPNLRVDDIVKLTDNIVALQKLQDGHEGFGSAMEKDLDELGRVMEVNKKGTAKVIFQNDYSWWLNPAALTLVFKEEERQPPANSDSSKEGEIQLAKAPKKRPQDILVSLKDDVSEIYNVAVDSVAEGVVDLVHKGKSIIQNVEKNFSKRVSNETLRSLKEEYPSAFEDRSEHYDEMMKSLAESVHDLADQGKSAMQDFGDKISKNVADETLRKLKEGAFQERRAAVSETERSMSQVHDPDSDEVYRMKSSPRGLLVIINNNHFTANSEYLTKRVGSKKDVEEMADLFSRYLDFKVLYLLDVETRCQLLQELRNISENEEYRELDCLAVCIMSHGNADFFYTSDGRECKFSQVYTIFNSSCGIFRGKPKLFFMQVCRGSKGGEYGDPDGPTDDNTFVTCHANTKDPDMADMLFVYSCFEGYKAFRLSQEGSIFIQSLVKVFREYADKEHINSMLIRVNREVHDRIHGNSGRTQVSQPKHTMTKFLYFWPGIKFDP